MRADGSPELSMSSSLTLRPPDAGSRTDSLAVVGSPESEGCCPDSFRPEHCWSRRRR